MPTTIKRILDNKTLLSLIIMLMVILLALGALFYDARYNRGYEKVSVKRDGYTYTFLFDKKAVLSDEGMVLAQGKDLNYETSIAVDFYISEEQKESSCSDGVEAFIAQTSYGDYQVCKHIFGNAIANMNFNVDGTWHHAAVLTPALGRNLKPYDKELDMETVRVIVESVKVTK